MSASQRRYLVEGAAECVDIALLRRRANTNFRQARSLSLSLHLLTKSTRPLQRQILQEPKHRATTTTTTTQRYGRLLASTSGAMYGNVPLISVGTDSSSSDSIER